ncbi:DNA-binding protein K10 [Drosophila pseudoobscura]|uniref:DNA-binding protein K10 n=1 Tax=Drosophila pseudoobscura pseudoobscura TaxID=46245 RepID=A0A6I8UGP5_DROPS|nr:DNA-binding protein K10 [Drosophila pseudoobscura]
MVFKYNNQQNRAMQQNQSQQHSHNARAAAAPYRKPFRGAPVAGSKANQMMYSSCQMPSDPLYIDFNRPTTVPPTKSAAGSATQGQAHVLTVPAARHQGTASPAAKPQGTACSTGPLKTNANPAQSTAWEMARKKPLKSKQQPKGKHQLPLQQEFSGHLSGNVHANGNSEGVHKWPPKQRFHPQNRFNGGGFNRPPPSHGCPHHMMPVMGLMGPGPRPRCGRPMPMAPFPPMPYPPQMVPPMAMRCPMPPMGGPPPPPHFMRHNGRGAPIHMMGGPPMHLMGPRMPLRGMPPGGPFGGGMNMNGGPNGGRIKKPNPVLIKQVVKGKSTIKTLKNMVNQYPLDKPWVTEQIRGEHDKKVDIENRLKGNKDDELFAQFKVQRDKFVELYEGARENYLKQEAASVMAKDAKPDKDKEKNTTQNAAQDAATPSP